MHKINMYALIISYHNLLYILQFKFDSLYKPELRILDDDGQLSSIDPLQEMGGELTQ